MMLSESGKTDRTTDLLACAALEPRLRSLLVFTSSAELLRATADRMAAFISVVSGRGTPLITLTFSDSEERLWGSHVPRRTASGLRLRWRRGPLMQSGRNRPRVVLIPDLTNVSVALARACIALMDTEVAGLQRTGEARTWVPDLCWIAGCTRDRIGEVSPHLLDRFALRLFDQQVSTTDRGEAVWEFASGGGEPAREHRDPIPDAISERLLAASTRSIPMEPGVTSEVVSLSKLSDGVRRDLALARLARGLARWNEAKAVGVDHVRQAAELLDIAPKTAVIPAAADGTDSALETAEVAKPSSERVQDGAPEVLQAESIEKPSGEMPPGEIVFEADTEVAFPAKATLAGAYPEDTTPAWRPMDSLKLPAGSAGTTKSNEGPAIGTQPAVAVRDIAFVSTILEAAKYQNIRDVAPDDFRLERGDLRSYRRAPLPQQLFVCLFDHTSTQDCDWETALLPHLQWAYVSRARVSLIQVGAGNAGEPLRATQINARSLLSRAISKALEQPPGNASPLAHGLHLAVRALHAAVERGRGRARHARFVILSDGRGNVPLEASQRGEITQAVGNRGVADAIEIGRELVTMNYVESFFLDPQPQQYPDLPVTLARVMGAELQAVPIRKIEVARG